MADVFEEAAAILKQSFVPRRLVDLILGCDVIHFVGDIAEVGYS